MMAFKCENYEYSMISKLVRPYANLDPNTATVCVRTHSSEAIEEIFLE